MGAAFWGATFFGLAIFESISGLAIFLGGSFVGMGADRFRDFDKETRSASGGNIFFCGSEGAVGVSRDTAGVASALVLAFFPVVDFGSSLEIFNSLLPVVNALADWNSQEIKDGGAAELMARRGKSFNASKKFLVIVEECFLAAS